MELLSEFSQDAKQQRLLAVEIVVDGALADIGACCHRPGRRRGNAYFRDAMERRDEDIDFLAAAAIRKAAQVGNH